MERDRKVKNQKGQFGKGHQSKLIQRGDALRMFLSCSSLVSKVILVSISEGRGE